MLGLLLDISNRLKSIDGEIFYSDLVEFVRNWKALARERASSVPGHLIWKSISIHKGEWNPEFILRSYKICVTQNALTIIHNLVVAPTRDYKVNLCRATVRELTGKDGATTEEVMKAVSRMGFLCPPEVGPALRLQYREQPKGEQLLIAMHPLKADSSDSCDMIFSLNNPNELPVGLTLDGHYVNAIMVWSGEPKLHKGDEIFIFRTR